MDTILAAASPSLRRYVRRPVPFEGVRFHDPGSSCIELAVVISEHTQIVTKEPVCTFDRQREHVGHLKQHGQCGMAFRAMEIREKVLRK